MGRLKLPLESWVGEKESTFRRLNLLLEELGYVQKNDAEDGGISYGGRSVGGFCILEE